MNALLSIEHLTMRFDGLVAVDDRAEALHPSIIWLDRRYRLGHGKVMAIYVMAYTLGRGWIEYIRIDDVQLNDVLEGADEDDMLAVHDAITRARVTAEWDA